MGKIKRFYHTPNTSILDYGNRKHLLELHAKKTIGINRTLFWKLVFVRKLEAESTSPTAFSLEHWKMEKRPLQYL